MIKFCKKIKCYWSDTEGTTAVEFALISIAFFTLVLSMLDISRAFMAWNTFQSALEDATRTALVQSDITEEEIESIIRNLMRNYTFSEDNIDLANLTVEFSTLSDIRFIDVNGSYTYTPIIGALLPATWTEIDLNAQSRHPIPTD